MMNKLEKAEKRMWDMTEQYIDMKKLLAEHIKRFDSHSARESKKGEVFKWNTPITNEFIAFGLFCYHHGKIDGLKLTTKQQDKQGELD